jgi:hypothetical protein
MTDSPQADQGGWKTLSTGRKKWTASHTRLFIEHGYNSVYYCVYGEQARGEDLRFLRDLPGLKGLSLDGDIRDDGVVFDLSELESLVDLLEIKKTLRLEGLSKLENLSLVWRPGIESVAPLHRLRHIEGYRWAGESLECLGDKPQLDFLRLELMRRHRLSLRGLRGVRKLRKLWLAYGEAVDWEEAISVPSLQEIVIDSCKGINLEAVSQLPNLKVLRIENAGTIASLTPLRNHAALENFSIWKTDVVDGDMAPLLDMPNLTYIAVDKRKNFSHSLDQIRAFRRAAGLPLYVYDPAINQGAYTGSDEPPVAGRHPKDND